MKYSILPVVAFSLVLAIPALASNKEKESWDKKISKVLTPKGWELQDDTGKRVLDMTFEFITPPDEKGYALACTTKCGFINTELKTVIPFEYQQARLFYRGWAAVTNAKGKWIFIDRNGKTSNPNEFDEIPLPYSDASDWSGDSADDAGTAQYCDDGLIQVTLGGKHGLAARDGRVVVKPEYESVECFAKKYALAYRKSYDQPVLIDRNLKVTEFKVPAGYYPGLRSDSFNNGPKVRYGACAGDTPNYRCGLANTDGNFEIKPEYLGVKVLPNGLIALENTAYKYGVLDSKLQTRVDFMLDHDIDDYNVSENRVGVVQGGKVGYLDNAGNWAIQPQFDMADEYLPALSFSESMAVVRVGKFFGYIDLTGKLVIEAKFTRADSFSKGVATVEIDGKSRKIDKNGKFVN